MNDKPDLPTDPATFGLPFFWPMVAAGRMFGDALTELDKDERVATEESKLEHGLHPVLASANTPRLDLRTMVFRDYSPADAAGVATIVVAPYAGHSSVIADYHAGQSLMQTLLANGLQRVFLTDWKSATPDMKDLEIDQYLAELNVCVDEVGGRVNLVGLCQGGWMSAMFAARFPAKVASLVLAGSPIDTDAGNGPIKKMAHSYTTEMYEALVAQGDGLLLGTFMLAGWKNMHPEKSYVQNHIDLYEHIDDPAYVAKTETFASWYENPINLPGRWYMQAIVQLFKENRLAKGRFVALGRVLKLKTITCPVYLLAGEADDITTKEQVFNAEPLLGTPADKISKKLVPGGHIGLFMGASTLRDQWPAITRWIQGAGVA